jgi:hypothetical protein
MGAQATYVYCVLQARRRPRLARAPSGVSGLGRPRLLDAGRTLWLVVADAPLPRFGEAAIARGLKDLNWVSRCAIAHEKVVEHWLRAPAIVPMKLFTIFESDDRAVSYIGQERRKLDRIIRRVAGRHEWGVRVRLASAPAPDTRARQVKSGTGYLHAKKRVRDAAKEQSVRRRSRAEAAFKTLLARAVEADRHPPPAGGELNSRLLLDAAFLVSIDRGAEFRTAARRLTQALENAGCRLELTGPWPPYNFVEP